MDDLESLVAYLNDHPQAKFRRDLKPLATLPDACVVTAAKRLSSLSTGTRSAYASSYASSLERLLAKINRILKTQLRIAFGTEKLLRYHEGVFPLDSEITWVSQGVELITNPDYTPHIAKSRGLIRTWVGNWMVIEDPLCQYE